MNDEMLEHVKTQLGYMWCDDATEKVLKNYMADGLRFLQIYNPSANFESDNFASSLLVEYVRYALANARDDFKVNYKEELLLFSDMGRVENVSVEN